MKIRYSSLVILLIYFCIPLFSLFPEKKQPNRPVGIKGVIDLSRWDFDRHGEVELDGEWEYYPGQLLEPRDFDGAPGRKITYTTLKVPGAAETVSGVKRKIFTYNAPGYGTYRLKVLLSDDDIMALNNFAVHYGSYKIWVDDRLVDTNGNMEIENFTGGFYGQKLLPLKLRGTEFYLTLQSVHITRSVILSSYDNLLQKHTASSNVQIFLSGLVILMIFYHMVLFSLRHKEKYTLYFALFCFNYLFYQLFFSYNSSIHNFGLNNFISWIISGLGKQGVFVFEILWLFFCQGTLISGFLFIKELFKETFTPVLNTVIIAVLTIIVLFVPAIAYTFIVLKFVLKNFFSFTSNFLILFCILLMIYGLVRAVKERTPNAGIVLFGVFVTFLTAIIEIFSLIGVLSYFKTVTFGITFLLLCQAVIIARRFSQAFTKIEVMSERLIKLDTLKDEFLANTSHELRTPLNGIIGIAESLLDGSVEKLSVVVKQNLSLIAVSGRRLAALVNDILDFSRLKNREIELQLRAVDIKVITEMVLHLSGPLRGKKKIKLKDSIPDALPTVLGDENRLQQIMYNLVGNAIKFTEEGVVEISAAVKGGFVEISVTDSGIGIPGDKLETIFQSFEQADGSVSRKYGGTGLGLSLTKSLVELHKGSISVTSSPGKGSVFTFSIPLSGREHEGVLQEQQIVQLELPPVQNGPDETGFQTAGTLLPVGNSDKKNSVILAVDDEPVNLQVLNNMLSAEKYQVTRVSSGREVLDICDDEKKRPDIILLDIMMPGMSGFEVCRRLREKYNSFELPIIFLTAKNRNEDIVDGLAFGANDYLSKPFSKKVLLSRIETQLKLLKQQKELQIKERLENEMQVAKRIQTAIVPDAPQDKEFEIAVCLTPVKEVGGDYYDVLYDKEDNLWFAIGDVTGHGITPGLIMMMAQTSFSTKICETGNSTPAEAINAVNSRLYENITHRLQAQHSMTMNFLKYTGDGRFLHAGAHVPVIIYRAGSRKCERIKTNGTLLGMMPDISHAVSNAEFTLEKGDIMLLYTDGIIEARHKKNRSLLDLERLQDMLINQADKDVETIKNSILQQTLEWCGHKPADDIAMIVVRKK